MHISQFLYTTFWQWSFFAENCVYSPATWHKSMHPAVTPARQAGTGFTYRGDGRPSWPRWLVTYRDGL